MTSVPISSSFLVNSEEYTQESKVREESTAKELQEQMQRMITLQTEQQRQYTTENDAILSRAAAKTFSPPRSPISIPSNVLDDSTGSNTNTTTDNVPSYRGLIPSTSYDSDPNINNSALGLPDTNVGQGTLIWKGGGNQKKREATGVRSSRDTHTQQHQKPKQEDWTERQRQEPTPSFSTHLGVGTKQKGKSMQGGLDSYGGIHEQTPLDPDVKPMPPGYHNHPPRYHGVHDYHYSNPDYNDPYYQDDNIRTSSALQGQPNSLLSRFCCCIWDPLVHTVTEFLQAETLHRSFCYGAIDGMLTGAGIVSTFCGMNMLRLGALNTYSSEIRALVVVFTAATCFADSVCMALGHVWTTHVLAMAQARDRSEARIQLVNHKADAKGMLVDMLLQKGMLKIDAMSLADTLDGYPDLFVSALIGDSITAPSQQHRHQQQHLANSVSYDNEERLYGSVFAIPGTDVAVSEHDDSIVYVSGTEGAPQQQPQQQPNRHRNSISSLQQHWRGYPSYRHITDFEVDPDSAVVTAANQESRKESFFMMMGFSLFAVIPSLIYTLVPTLIHGIHVDSTLDFGDGFTSYASPSSSSSIINPNSLAITLTACIMWCLGVWKSRFLDSNWLLFGVETVSVLLICILCAYWLGALLNHLFLPNEYQITVITPSVLPTSAGDVIATHIKSLFKILRDD